MSGGEHRLSVAVTGPTGTFGFGLIPLTSFDWVFHSYPFVAGRPALKKNGADCVIAGGEDRLSAATRGKPTR
jgi:hypothetical protein